MNRILLTISSLIAIVLLYSCTGGSGIITNQKALESRLSAAGAGDTLILKNGIWADTRLIISVSGSEQKPIVLRAETPGKVIFSGNSSLSLAGDYIEVYGILFENGNCGTDPVISFRSGERVANHSRISSCAISFYNPPDRFITNNWVELYGKENRVDHCTFTGKLNAGVTLAVRLNGVENQENRHLIEYNYFGERPRLGSNGGETIRVGTSTFSLRSSYTQIINNYFEHCNGEVEIISIKSCDNTISANTFYECEGVVTLRHGNNNIVTDNFFIGNSLPNTGGIRIINAGHIVRNNFFQELAGYRFRSAFGVMNGVPNSAINRYHMVRDARFDQNVFINCRNISFGLGSDNERTAVPENCTFTSNIIYNPESTELISVLDDMSGISFSGNLFDIAVKETSLPGFTFKVMRFEKGNDGLFSSPEYRPQLKASAANTGASWYSNEKKLKSFPTSFTICENLSIDEAIQKAANGDTLLIRDDIILTNSVIINKPLVFKGCATESGKNPELRFSSNRDQLPLIIIQNGGELKVSNLDFNGKSDGGIAEGAIVTQKEPAIEHFNLFADHCSFYDFTEGGVAAIKAYKSNFADSIVLSNCVFHDIAGLAISLKSETEDLGKYNVEYLILKNCLFYNILGSSIDLYRGGNDESTTGPTLTIDRCTFYNVENRELGSCIALTGVQKINISNSIFSESGKSGRVIRLEDQGWIQCMIDQNIFWNCGRLESFYDNRFGKNNIKMDPGFISSENADFNLKINSPLRGLLTEKKLPGYKQ